VVDECRNFGRIAGGEMPGQVHTWELMASATKTGTPSAEACLGGPGDDFDPASNIF